MAAKRNKPKASGSVTAKPLSIAILLLLLAGTFLFGRYSFSLWSREAPLSYPQLMQAIDYGDTCYVIGHKSPDTDTVVSAITYADLKTRLGLHCVPAVTGKINNETRFVLEHFGAAVPEVLEDAAGKTLILVDHSAYTQAVSGAEEAHIVELLDHHGLGSVTTADPLFIKDMAIGSTATIVYTSYIENDVPMNRVTAGLLMSAILSDTNNLSASTTTEADRDACEYLAAIAEVKDVDAYYREMREHAESYEGMTEDEIFHSDYKEYVMNGRNVAIAIVNAAAGQTDAMLESMKAYMHTYYTQQDMEHLYLLICDTHGGQSVLAFCGDGAEEAAQAAFGPLTDGNVLFDIVASRKKDIVPPLEKAYQELG